MKKVLSAAIVITFLLSGCASVPIESIAQSNLAKEFNPPTPDTAGIYIYRKDTPFGAALKKWVWVDKECIGETSKGIFFYHEVKGDQVHTISTESEFSPNDLVFNTESGKLYFIEQFIKIGVFVHGAGLELKDTLTGKREVLELNMAPKGTCGSHP